MKRKAVSLGDKRYRLFVSDTWIVKRICISWSKIWTEIICKQHNAKMTCDWGYYKQIIFLHKKYLVHRLVANAFLWLDLTDKSVAVCHKDDSVENNKLDNLFLWTWKSNSFDRFRFKISKQAISKIRDLINKWYNDNDIFNNFYDG